jgi:hypothetical protein
MPIEVGASLLYGHSHFSKCPHYFYFRIVIPGRYPVWYAMPSGLRAAFLK